MLDGDGRDRPELRPRIGGRRGEVPMERAPRLRSALLARISRLGAKSGHAPGRSRDVYSVRDVPRPPPFSRRCIVKARFVKMTPQGARASALHLAYIERDGVERDGSPGRLYGAGDDTPVRELISTPVAGEKRQFRFIVSPEDAREIDLTAFTRNLMAQMETDLRRPLVWGAVNHWNTDNPHVHVVVRGLDADGHDLTIDGRYIREGLRSRAETMLTYELGPRTPMQIDDQLAREVGQDRFTSLDRALQVRCGADGGLLETSLPARDRVAVGRLIARLGHLERLGLVARVSAVEWRFEPGWDATLRELGQTGDIIKRMHAAVTRPDPTRFAIVDESTAMDPIAGVVRSKGLHDELTGQPFMVIEAADGRICYTRVDLRTAERIAEGDIVRLAVGPSPPVVAGQPQIGRKAKARSPVQLRRLGPPLHFQQRYKGPAWLDTPEAAAVATSGSGLAGEVARSLSRRDANLRAMGVGRATRNSECRRPSDLADRERSDDDRRLARTRRSDSAGLPTPAAPPRRRAAPIPSCRWCSRPTSPPGCSGSGGASFHESSLAATSRACGASVGRCQSEPTLPWPMTLDAFFADSSKKSG